MKIVNLEQGSPEWHGWRNSLITATDSPVLLGLSPYSTPYKLWQTKLGVIERQEANAAMQRGSQLEPIARDKFISESGIFMAPACVESDEYNFLGASLDGVSSNGEYILEIKCNGHFYHSKVLQGEVPNFHMAQMQHQLLVSKAKKCFYYSFDGNNGVSIEVLPDPNFADNLLPKAREFMRCLAYYESPALTEKDYKDMSHNKSWNEYASIYQELDKSIKALEDKKEILRKKLIDLCELQNCEGSGIKILKSFTKGRVDYESIPELKVIDLDRYRKEPIACWKILVQSKD